MVDAGVCEPSGSQSVAVGNRSSLLPRNYTLSRLVKNRRSFKCDNNLHHFRSQIHLYRVPHEPSLIVIIAQGSNRRVKNIQIGSIGISEKKPTLSAGGSWKAQ